ncbi:MAG TPA: hypothetical protein GXZ48_06165 [Acholeplasmataceae bacterium]|nr:hypothetical protein [Acholeplasmataceae bacterium]
MRKSILLIFALLFVLAGCQLFSEKKGFEITNLSLSQEEGVTFQIKVHKLEISENDIISYGVVIVKEKVNEIEDLTFDKKDSFLESENLSFFLQIDEENYQTDYSLRAYVKYLDGEEEKYLYSESFEVFNLYSLAKESNNDFAKKVVRIVEEKK